MVVVVKQYRTVHITTTSIISKYYIISLAIDVTQKRMIPLSSFLDIIQFLNGYQVLVLLSMSCGLH